MGLYGVALIGYCLMSNHVHLIAKMAMDPEIEETALVSGWVR
jgi:REP element-mobilizing transposase RayT